MLLIALRLLVSVILALHLGYWAILLTKIEWVSYSSMVRPPTFLALLISGFGLYLFFPYGLKKRKRFRKCGMLIALFAFVVGIALDFVDRFRLVETVETAEVLRFENVHDPLSAGQKGLLVAMFRAEPIKINWRSSLANFFVGYNTCLCGDGDGIELGWEGMLFSCKHGDELYIRGFISFYSTRHVVWDI